MVIEKDEIKQLIQKDLQELRQREYWIEKLSRQTGGQPSLRPQGATNYNIQSSKKDIEKYEKEAEEITKTIIEKVERATANLSNDDQKKVISDLFNKPQSLKENIQTLEVSLDKSNQIKDTFNKYSGTDTSVKSSKFLDPER